ncbi:hypothetical protein pEaSNUABM54_00003 [Erwinia phage pEa_SNUABM_54]|nr:hypothetical protein pEaSNUABM54_00003 [Erwinia phage pEa_SNUABM_54]
MARILSLQSNGTISTESDIDYAARIARMKERRRGPVTSELELEREYSRLDADVNDIEQLQNIGSSLESLSETVVALAKNNQLDVAEIKQFEQLASVIASPAAADPIKLTTTDGQVSIESLTNVVRDIYQSITQSIRRVTNNTTAFVNRLRPTGAILRKDIKEVRDALMLYRDRVEIAIVPTDAMATLVSADGEYESVQLARSMTLLLDHTSYAVNELAIDTSAQAKAFSDWLAKLDFSSDDAYATTFSEVVKVPMVSPPGTWTTIENAGESRTQMAKISPVAFTGHQFLTYEPKTNPITPAEWLSSAVFETAFNYGTLGGGEILPSEDVFVVADVASVIRLLDQSLELLDLHDVYSRTSAVTTKYLLCTIATVDDISTARLAEASLLGEGNQASLALAIQAVNAVLMRTQRPYSDVLYETIRVINGVVSLASSVKTAVEKAE